MQELVEREWEFARDEGENDFGIRYYVKLLWGSECLDGEEARAYVEVILVTLTLALSISENRTCGQRLSLMGDVYLTVMSEGCITELRRSEIKSARKVQPSMSIRCVVSRFFDSNMLKPQSPGYCIADSRDLSGTRDKGQLSV
ncbi:hypothetical protein Tco_0522734 [Tanacetum coccineum]